MYCAHRTKTASICPKELFNLFLARPILECKPKISFSSGLFLLFIENIIQRDNEIVDLVSRLLFFVSNGITRDLPQTVSNHTSNYAVYGPFRVLSSNFNFYIILHPPHLISVAIGNFLQTLALYLLSFYLHRHMHTRICS